MNSSDDKMQAQSVGLGRGRLSHQESLIDLPSIPLFPESIPSIKLPENTVNGN